MKKNLAVIFGGRSSEHEVSCVSAVTIAKAVDLEKYNMFLIGITKDGEWKLVEDIAGIEDGSWKESPVSAIISPDTKGGLIISQDDMMKVQPIDVIFPVLHGMYGEDGTIQGLFEMADIPYVGCGVFASAASMDKFYTKLVVDTLGIRQAVYVPVLAEQLDDIDEVTARVEAKISYPVFVKPSKAGSSKGVSKADDRAALVVALKEAAKHDYKILVEETIVGREIECAVFGNGTEPVIASGVGEILAAADFYDFDAKYYNAESRTVVNPELPGDATERVRQAARRIFKAVDGYGLSRVDFFVTKDGEVIFNEINTMPGFTAISMYPMLFEAAGIPKPEMVTKLIEHGLKRYEA